MATSSPEVILLEHLDKSPGSLIRWNYDPTNIMRTWKSECGTYRIIHYPYLMLPYVLETENSKLVVSRCDSFGSAKAKALDDRASREI